MVGLLESKNLLYAHILFIFRNVRTPRCCRKRSITSAVWFSSLLNEGMRIRSRRRPVLSCTSFSIIIKSSGFACRQFDPLDEGRTESIMFHFIQSSNRTAFGRRHLVDFSLGMALCLQEQVGSALGCLHRHFQCIMRVEPDFDSPL